MVSYGGGVNTIATMIVLRDNGVTPKAITMSDPGSEWKLTYAYRDLVMRPWLAKIGFPDITVVTRKDELQYRKGGVNFETLLGLCHRTSSLPSVAYPPSKKCSQNYKAHPQKWWLDRQQWALDEWAKGQKIVRCIGYDTDEPRRIRDRFGDDDEHRKATPWYPVFEAGLSREDCVELIRAEPLICQISAAAGMDPVPRKSACKWCPNNTRDDWYDLYDQDREGFDEAVAMSRAAESTIESPDVVGLLRGFAPHGKRALHLWVDGAYGETIGAPPGAAGARSARTRDDGSDELPCECRM